MAGRPRCPAPPADAVHHPHLARLRRYVMTETGRLWDLVIPTSEIPADDALDTTTPAPEDIHYELVNRPAPPPVPNGWYSAASSAELAHGEVRSFIAVERH